MAGVTVGYSYPDDLPATWEEQQQRRAGQASGDDREPRPERRPNRVPGSRPGRGEGLDDIGNAERFAWQHGDAVRHVPVFGRWLVGDGCRWIGDETNTPLRLAQETALSLVEEASGVDDDAARGRLLAHVKVSAREPRLRAMLRIAESDPGLVLRPGDLDADAWALNASNGTIDLRTGDLHPHRHEDAITLLAGAAYRPAADAPTCELERALASTSAPTGSAVRRYRRVETPASIRSSTTRESGSRSAKCSYVASVTSPDPSAVRTRGRSTPTRCPPSVTSPCSCP